MIWAGLSGDGVIWLLADKIMPAPEGKARSAGVSAFAESTYLTAQIASPRGRMQMLWAMTMLMVSPTSSRNASAFRRWMLAIIIPNLHASPPLILRQRHLKMRQHFEDGCWRCVGLQLYASPPLILRQRHREMRQHFEDGCWRYVGLQLYASPRSNPKLLYHAR